MRAFWGARAVILSHVGFLTSHMYYRKPSSAEKRQNDVGCRRFAFLYFTTTWSEFTVLINLRVMCSKSSFRTGFQTQTFSFETGLATDYILKADVPTTPFVNFLTTFTGVISFSSLLFLCTIFHYVVVLTEAKFLQMPLKVYILHHSSEDGQFLVKLLKQRALNILLTPCN